MMDPSLLDGVSVVFVDTSCLVYLVEDAAGRGRAVSAVLALAKERGIRVVASVIAWTEALSRPLAAGDLELADDFRRLLSDSTTIVLEPVDVAIAEEAAALRVRHGLSLADALQLGTARVAGAGLVLTNDAAWRKIPGEARVALADELAFDVDDG
ncbi:MAG: PIN domain-containing protein [Spirochaetes bacterium]|nr:PIN domain-containing protein [Spirochaetota bacterium]